ncbi:ABCC5 [Acanthosepion pharaonis]|uniref:ABCC5 n=1 Tax=Acanthosepion pharaonis TaxID=158019 RepID=A0A812BD09_ACAPH|nr:ABCC5 [Sepia pharaonis]
MCLISPYLFSIPFYLFLGLGYSIYLMREWGLLAAAIFFVLLSRYIANVRSETVFLTDERVRKMSEIVNSIKLIKMYAWEKPFMESVMAIRKKEKKLLQPSTTLQSISTGIAPVIPTLSSVITIALFRATGHRISASTVDYYSFFFLFYTFIIFDITTIQIGDRGTNLSGGQKQRVSVARAVYSNRDIYLLDDPLSAVDVHVGRHIFYECFKKYMHERTIILVTHQLQYLKDCDLILVMDQGRIVECGTYDEVLQMNGYYARMIETFYTKPLTEENKNPTLAFATIVFGNWWLSYWITNTDNSHQKNSNSTVNDLQSERTSEAPSTIDLWISNTTQQTYLNSTYSPILFFTTNSSDTTTNSTVTNNSINKNDDKFYLIVYSGVAILIPIVFSLKGFSLAKVTMTASTNIHDKVLQSVMKSPMSFFDANPPGRILNRFSRDLDEADVNLPQLLDLMVQISTQSVLVILTSIQVEPWLVFAFIPALAGLIALRYFSIQAVRQLKRIENEKRSPLLSHVNTTAFGLVTINSFNQQDFFRERFRYHNDVNSSVNFMFDASLRWVGVRMDLLFTCVSIIAAFLFVFSRNSIAPSFAAMSLGFINLILNVSQFFIRLVNDTEARFTSIERLDEYMSLPVEVDDTANVRPTCADWPVSGDIQFSEVWMRYRDDMNPVLKQVSFHIFDKQKVGIVGRTGAGKSSLGSVIFRLVDIYKGHIYIDQVDIATISLEELRSKISIIPQDPVLFTGTMRYNLDPFSKYTDDELWQALSKVHMKNKIISMEVGLEFMVEENGDNLSVGERQLVCMARAILRNNKILLLDEATASIDTETDAMIQLTIRSAFAECTVLTIAHRLNTVLHCDKILVMDKGQVIEFASPNALMNDPESTFFQMVQLGDH